MKTRKQIIENLGREILKKEAPNWDFRIGTDSECCYGVNIIWVSDAHESIHYFFEQIIHEVAHVKLENKECIFSDGHDTNFYKEMARLMDKYSYMVDKYKELI